MVLFEFLQCTLFGHLQFVSFAASRHLLMHSPSADGYQKLGNRLRNLRSYFYPWWWTDNEEWRIYFFHIKHTGGHKRLSLSIRFYLRCHHAFKNSYILTLNNVINYLMKLNQLLHTSKYKRFDKAIELYLF